MCLNVTSVSASSRTTASPRRFRNLFSVIFLFVTIILCFLTPYCLNSELSNMSEKTFIKLGGTQNKAWVECTWWRVGFMCSLEQVVWNENDEDDGMERRRRSGKGRWRTTDAHPDEEATGKPRYELIWWVSSRFGSVGEWEQQSLHFDNWQLQWCFAEPEEGAL